MLYLSVLFLYLLLFTLCSLLTSSLFFFFNDTATTEIYTLSLHDALPIWTPRRGKVRDLKCIFRRCRSPRSSQPPKRIATYTAGIRRWSWWWRTRIRSGSLPRSLSSPPDTLY